MSRHLGDSSRVLIGDDATEQAFKTEDLSRFGLIHIAAHAMVDDEYPERSAILLAQGGNEEDGLLQYREIVDIDLDGHPEIISTSTSYEVLAFEHDGTFKWSSPSLSGALTQYCTDPAISDMDHDGSPEIIAGAAILAADGSVRGIGQHGIGYNPDGGVGSSSFAVARQRHWSAAP